MKRFTQSFLIIMTMVLTAVAQPNQYDPPWNPPIKNTLSFTVPGVDNVPDIFGDINNPQLVIFMGGNQFMVLDDLLAAFKVKHPEYQRILVETLPPGLLLKQIKTGSLLIGNMHITVKLDVYTAGKNAIEENKELFSHSRPFSSTKLALMVHKGNPKKIMSLLDLGRNDVRISMPDKAIEGIGKHVEEAYKKVGGQQLYDKVMQQKVADTTTYITQIHHRQSPMRILYNQSDVAPVWVTEFLYQKRLNHPVEMVAIPEAYNHTSLSVAGLLKDAPHKKAGEEFLKFLTSKEAKEVFKKYGFEEPSVE